MTANYDVVVVDTTESKGINLSISGGNTVSVAANYAQGSNPGVVRGGVFGISLVGGLIYWNADQATRASNASYGVVQTRNATDIQVTAASVNIVPTQYYVQQEVARLEVAIAGATGAVGYEPISSYVEP